MCAAEEGPSPDGLGRFPSRDLRSDNDLGRILMFLEAQECDCKAPREHVCPGPGEPGGCSLDQMGDCPCCDGACACPPPKLHICARRQAGERCAKEHKKAERCTCCYGESGKSSRGRSCECHVLRPVCEHVLSADHDLPLAEWAELLLIYDRAGHGDPPAPRPAGFLSQEARVTLMEERAAAGLAIFAAGDVRAGEDDHLGVQALKGRRKGRIVR